MSANKRLMGGLDNDEEDTPAPNASRETAAEAAARIRRERESGERPRRLDGFNLKLQVHGEVPGFQLAIMNDDRNRIAEAKMHGWEPVHAKEIQGVGANVSSYNTDPGGLVRFLVGTKDTNEPLYGYLMKIPKEIYDEDQLVKQRYNERNDAALMRGKLPNQQESAEDAGTSYVKDVTKLTRPSA